MKSSDPTQTEGSAPDRSLSSVQPHLFVAFEAMRPLASPSRHSLADVETAILGRASVRRHVRSGPTEASTLELRIPDPRMSANHARITRVFGRWIVEDTGSRNGVLVNGVAVPRAPLADGDVIELGQTFLVFRLLADETADGIAADADADELAPPTPELATLEPSLARGFAELARIATTSVPILLVGETGTGKEVLARAVHHLSRRAGELVAVNCAALPESLVESQLFGHKRGAFSGALDDRVGLVRSADGGTLFLDEIGDLRASSQGALLRVLQEREVLALGATRPVKVDLRVIAATHRDLGHGTEHEWFRSDLLARLSGLVFALPPLRARRVDLGILVRNLLPRVAGERAERVTFTPAAARALLLHEWPFNVRELERCLETSSTLAGDGPIDLAHLPAPLRVGRPEPARAPVAGDGDEPGAAPAASHLEALLREHQGNVSAMAQALGKDRQQIRRWLRRYLLDPERFRRGEG